MTSRATLLTASTVLLCFAHPSWADIYKCEADGKKAAYQSTPCTSGKSVVVKVRTPAPPPQARPRTERAATPQELLDMQRAQERSRKFPLENHMSMDLPNTSLRLGLQLIADFVGYDLVMDPSINEEGDFSYRDRPAGAILADVASRYGLLIKTDARTIAVKRR